MSSLYTGLVNLQEKKFVIIENKKNRLRRLQRRIHNWCNLLTDKVMVGKKVVMVTLTYAPGQEWEPNDIRDFMLWVRKQTKIYAYSWCSELQKRGAVHYHIELLIDRDARIPFPDRAGGWKDGMSQVEGVKTPFYVCKYSGKEYQKEYENFPKGIRAFAVWFDDQTLKVALRYASLKSWEKFYVDLDGWGELDFWRRHQRSLNGWICWKHFDDEFDAILEKALWEKTFASSP